MPGANESLRHLPTQEWARLEQVLRDFEAAWIQGRQPAIETYRPDGATSGPLLVELIHIDLEFRLKAGEPARVETYLRQYPELAANPDAAVELIRAEYELRRRREPELTCDEYRQRFPQLVDRIATALVRPPSAEAASMAGLTTEPAAAAPPQPAGRDWTIAEGRYRPRDFLARGGLGEVYRAHDQELQREVALKRIQERFADDAESRRRFLREARITSGLGHPGIVPVHGLVQDDQGRPCYAMRLIEGTSLKDAIAAFHAADQGRRDPGERSLALRELLSRFVAVCNTIAYAHSRGIVHCDIKPANVMLGKYGETLVIDWGLARPVGQTEAQRAGGADPLLPPGGDEEATRIGDARGTPAFMSPEQAAGRWDVVGPASDIYSLGAALYNLLTGEVPARGTDRSEVTQEARQGKTLSPQPLKPATPPALMAVCRKAMAPRPEERYATALELADEVTRWLADEKVRAYREPLGARLARWRRRHRTAVAAGAVALALVIAGGLAGSFLWQTAEWRSARQRYERLADLQRSGEGSDALALEELRAGRFARAEEILGPAVKPLENEPALDDLRSRLEARLDRTHRLAQFYRLADQAERLEAIQTTGGSDFYADSGAAGACEAGLAQLGVFEHEDWWDHLPDADLQADQRDELREDVFHYLLLLGIIRAKRAGPVLGKPEAKAFLQSGLDAVAVACRFRPDSYAARRIEAVGLLAIGHFEQIKPFTVQQPTSATDHYFVGLVYLGVAAGLDPAQSQPLVEQLLYRQAAALAGIDLQHPAESAVFHFRRAADLRPKHYWAHAWLGLGLLEEGNAGAAELAYDTCVALRPDYVPGYFLRGAALSKQWAAATDPKVKERLFERALADFTHAIDLDPREPRAYLGRGSVYHRKGDYDRALADYTQAISLDPKDAVVFNTRGAVYRKKGDYDRALADFAESIRLAPNRAEPYNDRALAYLSKNDYDRAIDDFTEAIRRAPKEVQLYKNRASARYKKGDFDGAIADYSEVLRRAAKDPEVYRERGAVYAAKGIWTQATADFGRLTALQPDNATAWYHQAVAHLAAGDVPAYRRVCAQMLEHFGGTRDASVASSVLYACVVRPDAVEPTDRLTQLADVAAPSFKGNVRLAGAVAYRRGRYEEAVRRFDEAAQVFALRPWDWLFLAMAHQRLGHADEARQLLAKTVAWIDEADKPGAKEGRPSGPSWAGWYERVEVQALRGEAEAVLRETAPKDKE